MRGSDIKCNPVFFSYAILHFKNNEEYLSLYIDKNKLNQEIIKYLDENKIKLFSFDSFLKDLNVGSKDTYIIHKNS